MLQFPLPEDGDAFAISNYLLDVTEAAYLADDFDSFAHCFHVPNTVGSFEGDYVVETRAALEANFNAMRATFEAKGVVALRRKTVSAKHLDPNTVQATFTSQLVIRGHVLGDEAAAMSLIRKIDGRWQVVESRYAQQDPDITRSLHRSQSQR